MRRYSQILNENSLAGHDCYSLERDVEPSREQQPTLLDVFSDASFFVLNGVGNAVGVSLIKQGSAFQRGFIHRPHRKIYNINQAELLSAVMTLKKLPRNSVKELFLDSRNAFICLAEVKRKFSGICGAPLGIQTSEIEAALRRHQFLKITWVVRENLDLKCADLVAYAINSADRLRIDRALTEIFGKYSISLFDQETLQIAACPAPGI